MKSFDREHVCYSNLYVCLGMWIKGRESKFWGSGVGKEVLAPELEVECGEVGGGE